jgi:hypothetical protein
VSLEGTLIIFYRYRLVVDCSYAFESGGSYLLYAFPL